MISNIDFQYGLISLCPQNGKMRREQRTSSADERETLREERSSIVLWRRPLTTINYGTRELALTLAEWAQQ